MEEHMAKSVKKKVMEKSSVAPPKKKSTKSLGRSTSPTHEEIEARAYRIWEDGGRQTGTADQDWTRAEEESKA